MELFLCLLMRFYIFYHACQLFYERHVNAYIVFVNTVMYVLTSNKRKQDQHINHRKKNLIIKINNICIY